MYAKRFEEDTRRYIVLQHLYIYIYMLHSKFSLKQWWKDNFLEMFRLLVLQQPHLELFFSRFSSVSGNILQKVFNTLNSKNSKTRYLVSHSRRRKRKAQWLIINKMLNKVRKYICMEIVSTLLQYMVLKRKKQKRTIREEYGTISGTLN